jgi:hypothetical protein
MAKDDVSDVNTTTNGSDSGDGGNFLGDIVNFVGEFVTAPYRAKKEEHEMNMKTAQANVEALQNRSNYYNQMLEVSKYELDMANLTKELEAEARRKKFQGDTATSDALIAQATLQKQNLKLISGLMNSNNPVEQQQGFSLMNADSMYKNAAATAQMATAAYSVAQERNMQLQNDNFSMSRDTMIALQSGMDPEHAAAFIYSKDENAKLAIAAEATQLQNARAMLKSSTKNSMSNLTDYEVNNMPLGTAMRTMERIRSGEQPHKLYEVQLPSGFFGGTASKFVDAADAEKLYNEKKLSEIQWNVIKKDIDAALKGDTSKSSNTNNTSNESTSSNKIAIDDMKKYLPNKK